MKWLLATLLVIGSLQFSSGAYIHVKARFAQKLLLNARLRMAERGIDLIVLSGITGRTLAFGPGHMQGSALPGERGNSVIGGHRDTHFEFLRDVVVNDRFTIETTDGESRWFQIVDAGVKDSRTSGIRLDSEANLLTLVTCYPFDAVDTGGSLRFVVTARQLPMAGNSIALAGR